MHYHAVKSIAQLPASGWKQRMTIKIKPQQNPTEEQPKSFACNTVLMINIRFDQPTNRLSFKHLWYWMVRCSISEKKTKKRRCSLGTFFCINMSKNANRTAKCLAKYTNVWRRRRATAPCAWIIKKNQLTGRTPCGLGGIAPRNEP